MVRLAPLRVVPAAAVALLAAGPWAAAPAQEVLLGTAEYVQNFDTLRSAGRGSITGTNPLPLGEAPFTTQSSAALNGWFLRHSDARDAASPNSTTNPFNAHLFEPNEGLQFRGRAYSFGAVDATDRAVGFIQTSNNVTPIPTVGAVFRNNTGQTAASVTITYVGEQWRLGARDGTAAGQADRLDFSFAVGVSSIAAGGFTNFDALDFASVRTESSPTGSALDGNSARQTVTATISFGPAGFAANDTLAVRWQDFDFAAGADDGLAIDDFRIFVTPVPEPASVLGVCAAAAGAVGVVRRARARRRAAGLPAAGPAA